MKSLILATSLTAAVVAAPVTAQEANDPFIATQGSALTPLLILAGAAATIIAVGAASGTD